MCSYKVLEEYDKSISDDELKKLLMINYIELLLLLR